jgi:hypothetical protein
MSRRCRIADIVGKKINSQNTMRKLSKLLKMIVIPALMIVGISSCNKNDFEVKPQDKVQSFAPVSSNKLGFLEFKDVETFQQTVSKLKSLSQDERIVWEKEHNFTSLKSIHEKVLSNERELLISLNIRFKNNSKIEPEDFPIKHSDSFEQYKNSIVSTGNRISDSPIMDIGIIEYATVVNKDGFVRIGKALFQFEKNTTKISKIEDIEVLNDLEVINQTKKSTSEIKILTHEYSSKNLKVSQSGTERGAGMYGNKVALCQIDYSNGLRLGIPNDPTPGAYPISVFGAYYWVIPTHSRTCWMAVHSQSFWGWSAATNCQVLTSGNISVIFGRTNNNGEFSTSYTRDGNDTLSQISQAFLVNIADEPSLNLQVVCVISKQL